MAALLSSKTLPCCEEELRKLASQYRTPFYLYDKEKIVNGANFFYDCFAWVRSLTGTSFKNYFAVKTTPTPMILKMLHEECDMGMDCSSLGELLLCERLGIKGEDVMFTSNNTPLAEYRKAFEMGAIINLDDYSQIDNLKKALEGGMPDVIAFRFNPGPDHSIKCNKFIGNPVEAKFGLTKAQLFAAFQKCKEYGVKRFGVHAMIVTNFLNILDLAETARMMFTLAVEIKNETGISVEFVNMGGWYRRELPSR
ncbi:protein TabA-like [Oculina patagonica]